MHHLITKTVLNARNLILTATETLQNGDILDFGIYPADVIFFTICTYNYTHGTQKLDIQLSHIQGHLVWKVACKDMCLKIS